MPVETIAIDEASVDDAVPSTDELTGRQDDQGPIFGIATLYNETDNSTGQYPDEFYDADDVSAMQLAKTFYTPQLKTGFVLRLRWHTVRTGLRRRLLL